MTLLKKAGIYLIPKNYRAMSNLQCVSKLSERVVVNQLCLHSVCGFPLSSFQSAYRAGHSNEAAFVTVQSDILLNMDQHKVTQLVLIVLSSAFDTVDHDILFNIMNCTFGVSATALNWFSSYLQSRLQRVNINGMVSNNTDLDQGVPQGSCIGPAEFKEYSSLAFMSLFSTGNWGILTLMTIKYTIVSTLILRIVYIRLWNGASVIPAAGCEA